MKKIILSLAISFDGYITNKEGDHEWIVGDGDKSGSYRI
jgi:riboflavin biosynthesis pyrimidine reductase